MSSRKGAGPATAAAAASASTTATTAAAAASPANRASSPSPSAALSRGSMTSNGSTAALQFLNARWRAVDAAANDSSLKTDEKPEIHKEKGSSQGTPVVSHQHQIKASGNQAKGGSGGGAWGRRH